MLAERRVALVTGGGTISSVGAHPHDFVNYGSSGSKLASPEELLARVPEVSQQATIVPVPFHTGNSLAVAEEQWLQLNRLLHDTASTMGPLDGIVVTHGSATLEQTAFFLSLSVKLSCPVVLVAALRPLGVLGSDAPINLVNAVRLAASGAARSSGVLVLMNNEIHAPRELTKGAGYSVDAFHSPNTGALGYVDADGEVSLYALPARRSAPDTEFEVRDATALPAVGIAYSYAGADGTVIEALVEAGVAGVVSAGHGAGSVTPREYEALLLARERGVAVVQASHAGRGRVLLTDRRRRDGILAADNLNPLKARILLMLALTTTTRQEGLQSVFARY